MDFLKKPFILFHSFLKLTSFEPGLVDSPPTSIILQPFLIKFLARSIAEFVLLNGGSDFAGDGTSMSESATQLDVVHHLWDGTSGSTIAQTKNADDITLPSHTGSTQRPFLLTCSWGNAVIHVDTNANTGAIFPITWSSSTSNVGSSVATDFQGVPLNELTLAQADGYGFDGLMAEINSSEEEECESCTI